jgi:hypothetical protein
MVYPVGKASFEKLSICSRRIPMLNVQHELRQPVSIDFAPVGSVCEWCGKPALQTLTVIGGRGHNERGYFCSGCGKEFIRIVASDLRREIPAETAAAR